MATFGYNTIGTTGTDNPGNNYIWVKLTSTPGANGTLSAGHVYCDKRSGVAAPNIDVALYSSDGGSPAKPLNRLTAASHTGTAAGASFGWVDVDVSGDAVSITSGTQYFGCIRITNSQTSGFPDVDIKLDSNSGALESYYALSNDATFPASAPTLTNLTDERFSFYFTSTDAAGNTGTIAANLTPLAIAATGRETFSGTVAAYLTPLTISATGTIPGGTTGAIAANLGNIQGSGTGGQTFIGAVAANLPALQIASLGGVLPANFFTTTFPLTENPLSQGATWTNGATDGVDWTDNRTTTNKVFGTQTGNNTGSGVGVTPSKYDDSISVLKGTFAADQYARGVVFNTVAGGDYGTEVELLLRFQITAHTARGYEIEFSTNPALNIRGGYFDIVRWNGTVGDFTPLLHLDRGQTAPGGGLAARAVVTGDVLEAKMVGNTISVYINGTFFASTTDNTWTNGNPGVGHYLNNGGNTGNDSDYGFSSFTAETLYSGTIAANLPKLQVAATGISGNDTTGSIAANLPKLQCLAAGTQTDNGTIAANLPALVIAATGLGQTGNIGAIAANLGTLSISATGSETFIGSGAPRIPGLVIVGAGSVVLIAPGSGAAVLNTPPSIGVAVSS